MLEMIDTLCRFGFAGKSSLDFDLSERFAKNSKVYNNHGIFMPNFQ